MDIKTSCSDEQLVVLAQKGHRDAYNILLGRYYHRIQKIIYLYLNDPTNVNNLVQEVLLKVYRYLENFNKESLFSTWLYKIIQNTVKNHYREMGQKVHLETQYPEDQENTLKYSPEYLLINNEFMEQLEAAIFELSEELRLCYGMLLFDGYTYADIAKKLHCPIGTVRSRIFRARKQLTDYLGHKIVKYQ